MTWPFATDSFDAPVASREVIELGADEVLLPGLVDTHVHVNEPGRTEWEGFDSATRAAAAGGVTTIIDMPLNSIPPTTIVANLRVKQESAAGQVHVDVGFWGGAIPGNYADLAALHAAGVFGYKCFLLDSGVPEFPPLDPAGFAAAMAEAARLGALVVVHAEDAGLDGLAAGDIDLIVSGHSPCTVDLKRLDSGDYGQAWGGIASLQLGLAAVWTAARERGVTLADIVRWMATQPADRLGLPHKGRIAVGADADLCVFAPGAEFIVDPRQLLHRNPVSAYAGRRLVGIAAQAWLRGERIDPHGEPHGRLLTRGLR